MFQSGQKNMIEFFSGSKTVSNVFANKNWTVVTIDSNQKLTPSICCDILTIEKNNLPVSPNFLWFSPPCTHFSRAAKSSHWQKNVIKYRQYSYTPLTIEAKKSISILQKCIDIINWFPDVPFVIENPVGRIQHIDCLKKLGHNRYFVNYFNFGFPYSKETYLFTNLFLPFPTKKFRIVAPGLCTIHSTFQRSKIPSQLVQKIYNYIPNGKS